MKIATKTFLINLSLQLPYSMNDQVLFCAINQAIGGCISEVLYLSEYDLVGPKTMSNRITSWISTCLLKHHEYNCDKQYTNVV